METRTAPAGSKNAFGMDIGGQTFLKPPSVGSASRQSFATFLILCSTSFFLGILYTQLPYDYPILWAAPTVADLPSNISLALDTLETHMKILYHSPPLIPRILHIVVGTGLLGFFIKLIRPTESNLLFDGASLALYVVGIVVYITNIVKGMRMAAAGLYADSDQIIVDDVHPFTPAWEGKGIGRSDSLRVLSASHTILALVLIGVLVLQAGQWYADRKDRQEIEKAREATWNAMRAKAGLPVSGASGSGGGASATGKEKKRA